MTIDEMILKLDKLANEVMYLEDDIENMEFEAIGTETKIPKDALVTAMDARESIEHAAHSLRIIANANLPF